MCRELLYDYVCGSLDKERVRAVEESLQENDDVQNDLRALEEGIKYCDYLRKTRLAEAYIESLSKPPKSWKDLGEKWKSLPSAVRWGVESFVVAIFIGLFVFLIPKEYLPWNKVTTFTLAEVDRTENRFEITTEEETATPTSAVTEATYGPPTTLKVVALNKNEANTTSTTIGITTTTMVIAAQPVSLPAASAVKAKGEIYRLFMSSGKVDQVTPVLVEKIMALGGQKAGEVQLGWRRRQGSYFHFSMPDANYEELVKYLQTFGQVRIVKESHSRVMPPGTIRLILWLEATTEEPTIENDNIEEPSAQE